MPPDQGAAPGPSNQQAAPVPPSAKSPNPTVLDTVFILFASVTLLLLLFWVVGQAGGTQLINTLPPWLISMISSVWAKVGLGSGTVASLILRNWVSKDEPAPNYLVWILVFVIFLLAAVFAVALLMRFINPSPPPKPTVYPSIMTLKLEAPAAYVGKVLRIGQKPQLELVELNPLNNFVSLSPTEKGGYTFIYKSSYKMPPGGHFNVQVNWARMTGMLSPPRIVDYDICLKPTFEAITTDLTILLECAGDSCKSAKEDPRLMVRCDQAAELRLLDVVYASDAKTTAGAERWVVPSLETLQKIPDSERVGFTQFEIEYQPSAAAKVGDSYYYAISVNGQAVYINNFPPNSLIKVLAHDKNLIQFGLENLNFSGKFSGNEKIHLTLVILKEGKEILRQELERDYVALRSAPSIDIQNQAGKFTWWGIYKKPTKENRYKVIVSSSGSPKLAVNAKSRFEALHRAFNGEPVVMVVRPPLGCNPSYGLALGLVQPTQQVQFTFSKAKASSILKWAKEQTDLINKKERLFQPNPWIEDILTESRSKCPEATSNSRIHP